MERERALREGGVSAKAGASAQAVYDEQRRDWIRRNHRIFWTVDAIAGLIIAAGLGLYIKWPLSGWFGGLAAGMALAFDITVRMNPPLWIEQWQVGAFGEQRTAQQLSQLDERWLVLHDLERRNGANIDHIVVGPPGVFLLDTKNVGTEVRIDGDVLVALRPDGRQRYRTSAPASKVRGAAADLSRALTLSQVGCWVHAVAVVWGDMQVPHSEARKLDWVAGASLVDWLQGLPIARDQERLGRVRRAFESGSVVV